MGSKIGHNIRQKKEWIGKKRDEETLCGQYADINQIVYIGKLDNLEYIIEKVLHWMQPLKLFDYTQQTKCADKRRKSGQRVECVHHVL